MTLLALRFLTVLLPAVLLDLILGDPRWLPHPFSRRCSWTWFWGTPGGCPTRCGGWGGPSLPWSRSCAGRFPRRPQGSG